MKIAIFHNYLDNIGGAEKVALTLAREFHADIYTTNIDAEKISKMGFPEVNIRSIGKVPLNAPWRQQMACRRFAHLNLKQAYDFYIIAGDWAVSGAVQNKPNIWYVHSPIREIWDLYQQIRCSLPLYKRWAYDVWAHHHRRLNKRYVGQVGKVACNSFNTLQRIRKYLGRDGIVIYPPIDNGKFYYQQNGNFWLSVNRLFWHKRIDIQLDAFRNLPNERLVLVGSYEPARHFRKYAEYVQRHKPANIEILSWVEEGKLRELYAACKGFITTAENEDFGMTVVEAMASGKPVIAPNQGGYKESVMPGASGMLIDGMDAQKLAQAITILGKDPQRYKEQCIEQAKKFSLQVFVKRMQEEMLK